MRFSYSALLLLFIAQASAQPLVIGGGKPTDAQLAQAKDTVARQTATSVIVGGKYSTMEVEHAYKIINSLKGQDLVLQVGYFEVIEPDASKANSPLQYQYLSNSTYYLWQIKAGEAFAIAGTRRGDKERQLYRFEAKPYPWAIVEAKKNGSEVIVVNKNAAAPDKDPPEEVDRINIMVGTDPTPPGPPGPPGPQPPTPPQPNPILPVTGFRVLIVLEKKDLSTLPAKQLSALTATEVLQYMNAKCVKDGTQPEWRIYDQHTNVSRESDVWKGAMDRVLNGKGDKKEGKATALPWLLVTNGSDGYEGPLPEDAAALLAKLKLYGGN